jgi:hypothetical protein
MRYSGEEEMGKEGVGFRGRSKSKSKSNEQEKGRRGIVGPKP